MLNDDLQPMVTGDFLRRGFISDGDPVRLQLYRGHDGDGSAGNGGTIWITAVRNKGAAMFDYVCEKAEYPIWVLRRNKELAIVVDFG